MTFSKVTWHNVIKIRYHYNCSLHFLYYKKRTKNKTHSVCIMELIMLHITFSLAGTLSVSHAGNIRLLPDHVEQENLVKVGSLQSPLRLASWMHDSFCCLWCWLFPNRKILNTWLLCLDYLMMAPPISSLSDYKHFLGSVGQYIHQLSKWIHWVVAFGLSRQVQRLEVTDLSFVVEFQMFFENWSPWCLLQDDEDGGLIL